MDEPASPRYEGASPPKSSLGAWLLKQARDVREVITTLTTDAAADRGETAKLRETVERLLAEAKRSEKVQAAQGVELEQVKQAVKQTQRQLAGLKISRGIHKARAQKVLQDMEDRLN